MNKVKLRNLRSNQLQLEIPRNLLKIKEYYNHNDFFVGAVLVLNSFYFQLFDADEYCYSFMEKNPSSFFQAKKGKIKLECFWKLHLQEEPHGT